MIKASVQKEYLKTISSVQSLSHVQFFATPWIAAHQASLSITNSRSLPKLKSFESVMPSSHLILCHALLQGIFLAQGLNPGLLHCRWALYYLNHRFSSVQFRHSVMSDSLRPHELRQARPLCPSPTPGVYPNSHPSSRWCHPAIS